MSVVISLSEAKAGKLAEKAPPPAIQVHGIGRVAFAAPDGETRLKDLYQRDPVRVLFPTPPKNEIPTAVFVTTSGGLVGGDVLELTAQAAEDVAVQFMPQAAEKVYRSAGRDSRIEVTLDVEKGAWAEWLPQETIVFDGARLRRRTRADVATGGRLLAGEMLVLGRGAMKETVLTGLVRDDWDVSRDGRLVWADALCLDGAIRETAAHPAGLDGATALATAIYVADDAGDYLETAREQSDTGEEAGIGADDVVFDNESGRGADTQIEVSEEEAAPQTAEQWLQSIDTDMGDFLRSRFLLDNQQGG